MQWFSYGANQHTAQPAGPACPHGLSGSLGKVHFRSTKRPTPAQQTYSSNTSGADVAISQQLVDIHAGFSPNLQLWQALPALCSPAIAFTGRDMSHRLRTRTVKLIFADIETNVTLSMFPPMDRFRVKHDRAPYSSPQRMRTRIAPRRVNPLLNTGGLAHAVHHESSTTNGCRSESCTGGAQSPAAATVATILLSRPAPKLNQGGQC